METDPSDPRLPTRPLWAFVLLALPVVGVVFVAIAYTGMWSLGVRGRDPEGQTVELAFTGCPEARPAVEARILDMGLPVLASAASDGTWTVRTTLPADPRAAGQIPATLAAPGRLVVRAEQQVVATSEDVLDASVRLDLMMSPRTLLKLGPAAADRVETYVRSTPIGALVFEVDGQRVGSHANANPVAKGELEIDPPLGGRERWDATAAWSVILDHPLPCAPTVTAR